MENLLSSVGKDIEEWITSRKEVFMNERDMQVALAWFLNSTGHYHKIYLEYRIPTSLMKRLLMEKGILENDEYNEKFPWANSANYFIDIVVENRGEFIPIELKYGTREIDSDYKMFGEDFSKLPFDIKTKMGLLGEQATSNLTMYAYWKDVRRLEILSDIFNNVPGGMALLLSNPRTYWDEPRDKEGYWEFSTHENNIVGGGLLKWGANYGKTVRDAHPQFCLDGKYACQWRDSNIKCTRAGKPEIFRYLMTLVSSDGNAVQYVVGDDEDSTSEGSSLEYKIDKNLNLKEEKLTVQENPEESINDNPFPGETEDFVWIVVKAKAQNQMALGVIHAYLRLSPDTTISDLREAFPNDIAPDKGVKELFVPKEEALEINKKMTLYFTRPNQLIRFSDGSEWAISTIWTRPSLYRLLEVAKNYGIKTMTLKLGQGFQLEAHSS